MFSVATGRSFIEVATLEQRVPMIHLFKRSGSTGEGHAPERTRPSRGWADVLKFIGGESAQPLRVLDFGTTSPHNINLLTSFGHSVYMANIVGEAQKPEWQLPPAADARADAPAEYDGERFAETVLDFSGRDFDVILLWDTADYLPPPLVPVLFARVRAVIRPGGMLLGFFHSKLEGPDNGYARYQLTEKNELRLLGSEPLPVRQVISNRGIEKYLEGFGTVRFFQGVDNLREVIATR